MSELSAVGYCDASMARIDEVRRELGRTVKALRSERGVTQEELAEESELSPRALQRLEAGRMARLSVVVAVADALGEPVWRLFQPVEPPKRRATGRAKARR